MTAIDETPQAAEDWWERLYSEADTIEPGAQPVRSVDEVKVTGRGSGRLRDWWQRPDGTELNAPAEAEAEEEPADEAGDNRELSSLGDDEAGVVVTEDGSGRWFRANPGYYPKRESLPLPSLPARPAFSPGSRRLLFNGTAAGAGYWWGLTPTILGWIESCGTAMSISGALVLGAGICLVTAHFWDRRTSHWMLGLRWFARIPLMSAITALALYAPAASH
ncbi:hypothetical protein ACFYNY_36260 [Streptomyces sp. NPDC006530]|uniref:hypothetical protein n=1 Tax=Streptomyces sp. NPDC006530 TaxID=3364750 RepID=UPI003679018C